jgi:hypothetical protein
MSIIQHKDPNAKVKCAVVYAPTGAQLISSTLITAGTKVLAVGIANLSAGATYVHFCDEAAATGNISVTSFAALGVEASKTVYQTLPLPYVCVSGCTIRTQGSQTTTFVYYEA